MAFSAGELPKGLSLDSNTGIITGTTPERGEYQITLTKLDDFGPSHHPIHRIEPPLPRSENEMRPLLTIVPQFHGTQRGIMIRYGRA
jgi:hypothetical protein